MSSESTDTYTNHSLYVDLGGAGASNVQLTIQNRAEWTEDQIVALVNAIDAAVVAHAPTSVTPSFTYTTDVRTEDYKNWDVDPATGAVTFG